MRVVLATDAFPPVCGSGGWSTYELARGLRTLGHHVAIVQARTGYRGETVTTYDGFSVTEVGVPATRLPFRHGPGSSASRWRQLGARLASLSTAMGADVIHGQDTNTGLAAVCAGADAGIPAVCSVRDYWPVCYWNTLRDNPAVPGSCPECSITSRVRCLRHRAGYAGPLVLPAIPLIGATLARRQAQLARADSLVAVSPAIARALVDRAPALASVRIEVIPTPVDVEALDAAARATRPPLPGDYAVFVGTLDRNMGIESLLSVVERARLPWPLMVVGDGPLRPSLEQHARQLGRDVRFTGWLDRPQALACLAHASVLVFPSHGAASPRPVLLEAATLRVPVAAMDGSGTRDIIKHEQTGLLASTTDELASAVERLVLRRDEARLLASEARQFVNRVFATPHVAARLSALYADLGAGQGPHHV